MQNISCFVVVPVIWLLHQECVLEEVFKNGGGTLPPTVMEEALR